MENKVKLSFKENIPAPKKIEGSGRRRKYPLNELEVGGKCLEIIYPLADKSTQNLISSVIRYYKSVNEGTDFTTEYLTVDDNNEIKGAIRVWRTK